VRPRPAARLPDRPAPTKVARGPRDTLPPPKMSRTASLTFAALALFLVLFPLGLAKPGLPLSLKSDEPAYYLMALSLAHDHDLKCEVRDIQRLGVEFPYNATKNLILASDDGWKTVYFGKPYLVSLLAAPAVALFGADGFVATNMALLMLSVWLGALYLRRYNPEWLALLYSAGFFLLSNAFAYVFWLHTETLCIAAVTTSLYLGLTPASAAPPVGRLARLARTFWNSHTRLAFSGAALVGAAYNKPYLAAFALPVAVAALRREGARGPLRWLAGVAAAGALVAGLSMALVGHPTSYLGVERQGVEVDQFDRMPELPEPLPPDPATGPRNSFQWIFRSFRADADLPLNALYFLVGRHTGLFPYAPFTLLSLLLFFAFSRRSLERWALAAALAAVALYLLTFLWFNWHGGGGFIGNRYYVNALPGFLFLVTRIAPAWLPLLGYALGALFVGSIFFTPFGAAVPNPTLQAHVRGGAFQLLPFERTLDRQIPGYRGEVGPAGSWVRGRSDLFRPIGEALWVVGGQPVEFELRTIAPLESPVFEIATKIAPNTIRIALGDDADTIRLDTTEPPADSRRITLHPGAGQAREHPDGSTYRSYRMVIEASRQIWHHEVVTFRESQKVPRNRRQPREGISEPDWEESDLDVLVGAIVTFLGEERDLEADVYAADWLRMSIPAELPAGRIVGTRVLVRNASQGVWRAEGAAAVRLSYHWEATDGGGGIFEGLRTALPRDLAPGEVVDVVMDIETPPRPGRFVLVLDPLRERLAWFADRRPERARRIPVEIVAGDDS